MEKLFIHDSCNYNGLHCNGVNLELQLSQEDIDQLEKLKI